jgi:hypothetical protein
VPLSEQDRSSVATSSSIWLIGAISADVFAIIAKHGRYIALSGKILATFCL